VIHPLPTPGFSFELLATLGHARAGVLHTPRGDIPTPVFMPVGTQGTVKAMTVGELEAPPLDARIILGNTYHLYLRPGLEIMAPPAACTRSPAGGGRSSPTRAASRCSAWPASTRSTTTASPSRATSTARRHRLTPEVSMQIQGVLGSDIAMAFDQCPPGDADDAAHERALARTTAWAKRSAAVARPPGQALFGIVQGGTDVARRRRHAAEIVPIGFDGTPWAACRSASRSPRCTGSWPSSPTSCPPIARAT
jgi:queuine tRNA-ribosyltransferase